MVKPSAVTLIHGIPRLYLPNPKPDVMHFFWKAFEMRFTAKMSKFDKGWFCKIVWSVEAKRIGWFFHVIRACWQILGLSVLGCTLRPRSPRVSFCSFGTSVDVPRFMRIPKKFCSSLSMFFASRMIVVGSQLRSAGRRLSRRTFAGNSKIIFAGAPHTMSRPLFAWWTLQSGTATHWPGKMFQAGKEYASTSWGDYFLYSVWLPVNHDKNMVRSLDSRTLRFLAFSEQFSSQYEVY